MKKLIVPLLTPFYQKEFDQESMIKLIKTVEDSADMFVACGLSGEGKALSSAQWREVVTTVREQTKKPLLAGIMQNVENVEWFLLVASQIGCEGVAIVLGMYTPNELQAIVQQAKALELQVLFYNNDTEPVHNVPLILSLAKEEHVIGMHDNTTNKLFLEELISALPHDAQFDVYQGTEVALNGQHVQTDGYCLALANVEPILCNTLKDDVINYNWQEFQQTITCYNLSSNRWYITLKALLYNRGIFRSAEEVTNIVL